MFFTEILVNFLFSSDKTHKNHFWVFKYSEALKVIIFSACSSMLNGLPGEETATRLRRLVEPQTARLASVNFILYIFPYFLHYC